MVSLSSTAAQSLIAKVIELDLFRAKQPIHHLAEELEADQAKEAKRQWNEDVRRKEKNSALQKQGTKVTTLKKASTLLCRSVIRNIGAIGSRGILSI